MWSLLFASVSLKESVLEIPYHMSYLEGEEKEAYMEDAQIIQNYVEANKQILKGMKWKAAEQFSVAHNYLDL